MINEIIPTLDYCYSAKCEVCSERNQIDGPFGTLVRHESFSGCVGAMAAHIEEQHRGEFNSLAGFTPDSVDGKELTVGVIRSRNAHLYSLEMHDNQPLT